MGRGRELTECVELIQRCLINVGQLFALVGRRVAIVWTRARVALSIGTPLSLYTNTVGPRQPLTTAGSPRAEPKFDRGAAWSLVHGHAVTSIVSVSTVSSTHHCLTISPSSRVHRQLRE